jgi:hypothetical protein
MLWLEILLAIIYIGGILFIVFFPRILSWALKTWNSLYGK